MNNPRIAVLIPVFQGENYVSEALRSVSQALVADEKKLVQAVYIADDASTDKSLEIAKSVWNGAVPLHILSSERNLGEYANVNRASVQMVADGIEWMLILHHDDLAKESWLREVGAQIITVDARVGAIGCSSSYLFDNGDYLEHHPDRARVGDVMHIGNPRSFSLLKHDMWWVMSGAAIRLKAFRDIGGFREGLKSSGDDILVVNLIKSNWDVLELSRPHVIRRLHTTNATRVLKGTFRELEGSMAFASMFDDVSGRGEKILRYYALFRKALQGLFSSLWSGRGRESLAFLRIAKAALRKLI